jgi:hypothetical protein
MLGIIIMSIIKRATAVLVALLAGCMASAQDAAPSPLDALRAGDYDTARAALSATVAGQPDAPLHLAYLEGLIRMRDQKFADAAEIFRSILAVAPDYEPARRELTFALVSMGETAGARYHAERLVAQTSDERLRAELRSLISSTGHGKSHGIGLQLAVLPSSNVSRGTKDNVIEIGDMPFVIDQASLAQSGVGLTFGISAWNRWVLSEDWSTTLSGALSAQFYDHAIANEQTASVKLDVHRPFAQGWFSAGPVAEVTFIDGDKSRQRVGLSASGSYSIVPGKNLSAEVTQLWQTFPGQKFRDGTDTAGYLSYQYVISPSTTLSISLPFERERTKLAHLDHDDIGAVIGLDREWSNGLITGLSAGLRRDTYLGDFPAFDESRRDKVSSIGISLLHRNLAFGRFTPKFRYTYTNSRSNIELFNYDSHDISISLSSQF